MDNVDPKKPSTLSDLLNADNNETQDPEEKEGTLAKLIRESEKKAKE